jgi:hypothetical protein
MSQIQDVKMDSSTQEKPLVDAVLNALMAMARDFIRQKIQTFPPIRG